MNNLDKGFLCGEKGGWQREWVHGALRNTGHVL